jgi:hypothetical protein
MVCLFFDNVEFKTTISWRPVRSSGATSDDVIRGKASLITRKRGGGGAPPLPNDGLSRLSAQPLSLQLELRAGSFRRFDYRAQCLSCRDDVTLIIFVAILQRQLLPHRALSLPARAVSRCRP